MSYCAECDELNRDLDKLDRKYGDAIAKAEQLEKERDQFRRSAGRWRELAYRKKHELNTLKSEHESLLSRLPKNADGDKVWFGDVVWWFRSALDDHPSSFVVANIHYDKKKDKWRFNGGDDNVFLSAESCQSAQTEGEGA